MTFHPLSELRSNPVPDPILTMFDRIERECQMTISRDLGSGPHRPFGSALPADVDKRLETPSRITVRPFKLRGSPPCPECGNRGPFHCECEVEDQANGMPWGDE